MGVMTVIVLVLGVATIQISVIRKLVAILVTEQIVTMVGNMLPSSVIIGYMIKN